MTENRDRPEWLVPIFSYLEASSKQPQTGLALLFLSVFGTGTLPHRYFRAILAWRRGLLSALWHGGHQLKHFWGRVACRREGNRYRWRVMVEFATGFDTAPPATGGSEAGSRGEEGLLSALRHGHLAHRYLSGIPAWRRGLLSALWHGDPQLKHFCGRVAWRREGNRYR